MTALDVMTAAADLIDDAVRASTMLQPVNVFDRPTSQRPTPRSTSGRRRLHAGRRSRIL